MTLQEAIDYIVNVLSSGCNYDETLDYKLTSYDYKRLDKDLKRGEDACRVVCAALEKQIPKKPTTETINRGISVSGEYDIDFNYLCPNCNTVVGDYETDDVFYKFCPDCGQALDWSENK